MNTQVRTEQDIFNVLGKIKQIRVESNEMLSKHYQNQLHNEISLDHYLELKVGDKIYFNDSKSSYAELICDESDKLMFIAISEKGDNLKKHTHNFIQDMKLIKGKLKETVSNKIYNGGDNIKILPFKLHGFLAEQLSIYTVVINL